MVPHADFAIDGVVWPNAAASRYVASDGMNWHVQQIGCGPSLLLVHGTGASVHSWEGLCSELAGDFALTAYDLPGHGFTDARPAADMSLDKIAERSGKLVTGLALAPRLIVAHSAGAAIAVRMVLDGRIPSPAAIIAVNGALLPFDGVARWLYPPLARFFAAGGYTAGMLARLAEQDGAVDRMLTSTGKRPPGRSVEFYKRLLRQRRHVQAALDMMSMWDLQPLQRDLPRLSVPLELIACGEDRSVPAQAAFAVADRVRGAHVHYLRNLGHLAHEERPAEIAAIVRGVLHKHGGTVPKHEAASQGEAN
jgi:magnesium chelatase accessory protein